MSNVLLCVTGGIAAYKAPHMVRGFIESGWNLKVLLTKNAERFVSPLVLEALSKDKVWREEDFLVPQGGAIPHIDLARWADLILVAPCTAETGARLAGGRGERLMESVILASKAPVLIFPAMNVQMLNHPSARRNFQILKDMGFSVIDPDSGYLACGTQGQGRLPGRDVILDEAKRAISKKDMKGLAVAVTAGPTREFWDPVRYISNPSSGKMGYSLAKTAWYRGADVQLISGPVSLPRPHFVKFTSVTTALEMLEEASKAMENCDVMVKAAAVGDFRFKSMSENKIKRRGLSEIQVSLVSNPDIASHLGSMKKPGQTLVGFAAETDHMVQNALEKMKSKALDMIVANDISEPGRGFASDFNSGVILDSRGGSFDFSGEKDKVSDLIWDRVLALREKPYL